MTNQNQLNVGYPAVISTCTKTCITQYNSGDDDVDNRPEDYCMLYPYFTLFSKYFEVSVYLECAGDLFLTCHYILN